MTDARSPRTAAGRALLADAEQNADGESVCLRVALIEADILAIEAEATAGTEDDPMHTDEEYIEYGAVQYRRGRAQAEAEAQAAPPDALRAQRDYLKGAFLDDPLTFATDPDGDCWFCGVPTEPIEDHDEADMSNDCRVTRARAALAAPATPLDVDASRVRENAHVPSWEHDLLSEPDFDPYAEHHESLALAAPATLPAIPDDTRIVWKRDHGMVIVTGDEEPQSLEIPAWAVRTIFDVAGKDPAEEARKVSAFINAHTGLDVAASRLYDTVRLMRSTVGHTHKEPWPCPVFEVDQALRSLARIIDPRYERPYPPDLDAIRKARIAAYAEQGEEAGK